jgi:hypothetical protein
MGLLIVEPSQSAKHDSDTRKRAQTPVELVHRTLSQAYDFCL